MIEHGAQGVFIDQNHRVGVALGEVAATIAMVPAEMRAFAARLLESADALERDAAAVADAVLTRAAWRMN